MPVGTGLIHYACDVTGLYHALKKIFLVPVEKVIPQYQLTLLRPDRKHAPSTHIASSWRSSKETRNGRDRIDETVCFGFIDEGLDAVSIVTDKLRPFDDVR